jgi:hypothetical protein
VQRLGSVVPPLHGADVPKLVKRLDEARIVRPEALLAELESVLDERAGGGEVALDDEQ